MKTVPRPLNAPAAISTLNPSGPVAAFGLLAEERHMALAWQSSVWVDVSDEQGALVLHIGGEIDEASRPSIEPVVIAAVNTADHVILDLRELTFCDSAGVAMVLTAAEEARRRGCRVSIDNLRPGVERVFDIAAIGDLVEIRA